MVLTYLYLAVLYSTAQMLKARATHVDELHSASTARSTARQRDRSRDSRWSPDVRHRWLRWLDRGARPNPKQRCPRCAPRSGIAVRTTKDIMWVSGVGLGMRRLSVIDVAGGSQPISNEDGTVHVVFNGEIYNHHALRSRLAPAHVLRSRTDTEVLVHLYEELGPDLVRELRGMFAFAIWDDRIERLTVARDRLGIKPLYYWTTPDGVAFASELRSLLALDEFPREIDRDAVNEYLALGYVPDPACIFKGVRKLPPGHLLTWDAERGVDVRRYWSACSARNTGDG